MCVHRCVCTDECAHRCSDFIRRLNVQERLGRLCLVPSHKPTGSLPALLKGACVSVWASGPLDLGTCHSSAAAGRRLLRGQALPLGTGALPGADRALLTGRQASGSRGHQHPSHSPVPQGPLSRWSPGGVSLGQKRQAMGQPLCPDPRNGCLGLASRISQGGRFRGCRPRTVS